MDEPIPPQEVPELPYPPTAVRPWSSLFLAYAAGFAAGAAFFALGPGGPVRWLAAVPTWTPVALVPLASWPLAWPTRQAGTWWPLGCMGLAAAGTFTGEALLMVVLTTAAPTV